MREFNESTRLKCASKSHCLSQIKKSASPQTARAHMSSKFVQFSKKRLSIRDIVLNATVTILLAFETGERFRVNLTTCFRQASQVKMSKKHWQLRRAQTSALQRWGSLGTGGAAVQGNTAGPLFTERGLSVSLLLLLPTVHSSSPLLTQTMPSCYTSDSVRVGDLRVTCVWRWGRHQVRSSQRWALMSANCDGHLLN